VADAWCRFHERASAGELGDDQTNDDEWWAVEFWLTGGDVWEDEVAVREGLLALIDAAQDDLLSYIGAGPLEAFVNTDESRLLWIEEQASKSGRFRRALANVWTWGSEPDAIAARLEKAAGTRLARPKGWTGP
jgi:hypothetical protein